MSISQQFCFVTRGPNAVLGEGAARLENAHLSRSWGAVEFPTQPHLALPEVVFFPIRCSRAHPPSDKEASSEEPTPHFDPTRAF